MGSKIEFAKKAWEHRKPIAIVGAISLVTVIGGGHDIVNAIERHAQQATADGGAAVDAAKDRVHDTANKHNTKANHSVGGIACKSVSITRHDGKQTLTVHLSGHTMPPDARINYFAQFYGAMPKNGNGQKGHDSVDLPNHTAAASHVETFVELASGETTACPTYKGKKPASYSQSMGQLGNIPMTVEVDA